MQLITTETTNKVDQNVWWKIVSNNSQRIRNINLSNEINHLAMPLNNVYEPLGVDFDGESTSKEAETKRNINLREIERNITNRKRPEQCITEKYTENQRKTPRRRIVPGNRPYGKKVTSDYGKKIFVVACSHLKRISRRIFNNSFEKTKSFIDVKSFIKIQYGNNNNHLLTTPSFLLKFSDDTFQAYLCLLSSHV